MGLAAIAMMAAVTGTTIARSTVIGIGTAIVEVAGTAAEFYRPNTARFKTFNGCQNGYTVQDGLCKPYRGY